MQNQNSALIIAKSENLRESLLVLLRAIPQIERVFQVEDTLSTGARHREIHPVLVLLDYDLPAAELATTLHQIRATWPQALLLVLVDSEQDCHSVRVAGADVALVKGVRAASLLEKIEESLAAQKK